GLGGGAASSVASGESAEDLDFASVQRENPEMERRCQEVIDACVALGADNPIVSIHDVGAGGLSNAIPELLHDSDVGGAIDLGRVPSDDPSLSPMQLWCNESQERYVLGVPQARMAEFAALCERERCPFAAVGVATAEEHLTVGYGVLADTAVESISGPAQHAGRSDHLRGSAALEGTPGPAQRAGRSDHPRGSAAQEGTSGPAQHAGRSDHPRGSAAQEGTSGPAQHAGRSDHPRGSAAQAGGPHPIDLPMDVLFGKAPKMH